MLISNRILILKFTFPFLAKTLASLLTSPTLQSHAINIHYHKFYDRDHDLRSMLKVARSNYKVAQILTTKNIYLS